MPYWKNTRTASNHPDLVGGYMRFELNTALDRIDGDYDEVPLARKIEDDTSGRALRDLVQQAVKETKSLFRGWNVQIVGKERDQTFIQVDMLSPKDVSKFYRGFVKLEQYKGTIFLNTPYHDLSELTFHPTGSNRVVYGDRHQAKVEDWLYEYGF